MTTILVLTLSCSLYDTFCRQKSIMIRRTSVWTFELSYLISLNPSSIVNTFAMTPMMIRSVTPIMSPTDVDVGARITNIPNLYIRTLIEAC